jgi:hypothetical protein
MTRRGALLAQEVVDGAPADEVSLASASAAIGSGLFFDRSGEVEVSGEGPSLELVVHAAAAEPPS